MKVLIVDDEAHVITAVKLLVPWGELGITELFEALTPQDAIRIIEEEQPELLITDIVMQDLSGIDLMKYISGSPLLVKVIVISGYNNFDYVRSSLQHGGVDYLLKPLDQNQLIAAVKKAIDAWNQEHDLCHTAQINKDQIDSMAILCRENLLSRLLSGEQPKQTYQKLLQISPELGNLSTFGFAYCGLEPFLPADASVWSERFQEYRDLLSEFLEQKDAGFLLPTGNAYEITLFLSDINTITLHGFEELLLKKQGIFPFPVCMGFALGHFPEDLLKTLTTAKEAFGRCNMTDFRPVLCQIDSSCDIPSDSFNEKQRETDDRMLLSALLTGNESFIDISIDLWVKNRFSDGQPLLFCILEVIKEEHELFNRWVELFRKRHEGFSHQTGYQLLRYPDLADSGMHFSFHLFKQRMHMDVFFLYRELKSIHSPEADMMYQVAHYIELNYNQPFSQFACAQMFFVNKEYLCRKFKQTFQINMITYLNNIRIEHAKQMLLDPLIKIRQIAHDVGFEDEKYFSRQFKKTTNMTPNDYRMLYMEQTAGGNSSFPISSSVL